LGEGHLYRLKAFWFRRPAVKLPDVILLNGTSSVGKSSLTLAALATRSGPSAFERMR